MIYSGKLDDIIVDFSGSREELKLCIKSIYNNKQLFDDFYENGAKLQGVKKLKEIAGVGLKESKRACDLYWDGRLPIYLIEDRKEKLEILARLPLAEQVSIK